MEETNGLSIFFQPNISVYKLFRGYKNKDLALDFPKDTCWNKFLFMFIVTNSLIKK